MLILKIIALQTSTMQTINLFYFWYSRKKSIVSSNNTINFITIYIIFLIYNFLLLYVY